MRTPITIEDVGPITLRNLKGALYTGKLITVNKQGDGFILVTKINLGYGWEELPRTELHIIEKAERV
jgi:hypothetical protein